MPLSEHERRVLDEIERGMFMGEQKSVRSGRLRWPARRSLFVGSAIGALVGLGYVLLGVISAGAVGVVGAVIGFVIIVVSCARVVGAYRAG